MTMKKIIASAVGLMIAGGIAATNASALENQFGGYWRTRAFAQDEFTPDKSYWRIDNRTRLYYTAKFSDDFKFVNKFEFNSIWGDDDGGDLGADGKTWRVKNSYADFNLGAANVKLGIQGAAIGRGFLFDNDFSGVLVNMGMGAASVTPFYISVATEDGGKADFDEHMLGVMGAFKAGALSVSPYLAYYTTGDAYVEKTDADGNVMTDAAGNPITEYKGDAEALYLGADLDLSKDAFSLWATMILNSYDVQDDDGVGFLAAFGAEAGMVHGQAFYASGDDAFMSAPGQSYYWSEILGYGTFDNNIPGGPGDAISNVWAANAGVSLKPSNKLEITGDVWYASLVEENAAGDSELGLEFDGKLAYSIMDNLKAEFVLAYLVAGDAVGDEDVTEGGVRISLKF